MVTIVILMMVAGFLALRLYTVLGKRSGHEQPLVKPAEERAGPQSAVRKIDAAPEAREPAVRTMESGAEAGVRQIVAVEPGFDAAQFLAGAQSAYRMTLEAFWKGDRDQLRTLVDDDVYAAFDAAIADRETSGDTLDNRLVSVERALIAGASLSGRDARITVRFDADIAAVTRGPDGIVVAGSTDDAVETHDVWTFARTLKSADPNWKLTDTDEA